ncbi:RnfABCDGE type electron transport complex subunit D [Buchnera aphidicola]|uniref:RnfABCDGE type electron transport complex subunit D n=1 Tax=Buchnera aphidicola TaxID=9 RepID=UPI00164CADCC|nr:RnfABCDGE type electron transport complex subunit D [Buchnera aphidicola]
MNILYISNTYNVKKIMILVIVACIPGLFTEIYFFGYGVLIQILLFIIISLLFEIIILKMRCKNIKNSLFDYSSVLTAFLLGLSVPCSLPWWMIIFSCFFSIVIAKYLYGGLGQNIFNPAMIGYVVLLITFPLHMTSWNEKNFSLSFYKDIKKSINLILFDEDTHNLKKICPDNFTEATPLDNFKTKTHFNYNLSSEELMIKKKTKSVSMAWKYINVSFLIGGLFLLYKKIICWRIPLSFLSSLVFFSSITYFYSQNIFCSPLFHLFSGGTMMCAFFIATDPVTTSFTKIGKIFFGIIIGFLVWVIRNYSDYPDGIAFAVLFANMIVPLMDSYLKTSSYGRNNL